MTEGAEDIGGIVSQSKVFIMYVTVIDHSTMLESSPWVMFRKQKDQNTSVEIHLLFGATSMSTLVFCLTRNFSGATPILLAVLALSCLPDSSWYSYAFSPPRLVGTSTLIYCRPVPKLPAISGPGGSLTAAPDPKRAPSSTSAYPIRRAEISTNF